MNEPQTDPQAELASREEVATARADAMLERIDRLQVAPPGGQREAVERDAQWRRLVKAARLPARAVRFVESRRALPNGPSPWLAARDKVAGKVGGGGVIIGLHGLQSRGKTVMAVDVALEQMRTGRRVLYLKLAELVEFYDAARSKHQDPDTWPRTERGVTEWASGHHLLILDEVEKARESDYVFQKFYQILDAIYDHGRDVILIANLTHERFEEAMGGKGSSLVERLNEGGGLLECKWEGFR